MKIPDPMIEPTMMEIPLTRPIFGFSVTISTFSCCFVADMSSASDALRVGLYEPFVLWTSPVDITCSDVQRSQTTTAVQRIDSIADGRSNAHTKQNARVELDYIRVIRHRHNNKLFSDLMQRCNQQAFQRQPVQPLTAKCQCCHSGFQEFPRSCSKNSQVDVKIPKLIKTVKNKVIQQGLNNNFTHTVK